MTNATRPPASSSSANRQPSRPGVLMPTHIVMWRPAIAQFVHFGSKAALTAPKSNFRFTPESGLN